MASGVPGMMQLQECLSGSLKPGTPEEEQAWIIIKTALTQGQDLETVLGTHKLPEQLTRQIIELTWSIVASHDVRVLEDIVLRKVTLPLSDLLKWLTRSTHYEVTIVTTNYDRLAEYAADAAGLVHLNGFGPGYFRNRETSAPWRLHRGDRPARMARLWKVHGSLDWFEREENEIICARFLRDRPPELTPVIVTPGVEKFQRTHNEPFRTVMAGADRALETAEAVFCVGYGFRDSHIEPKLVDRCRDHSIPFVVLAKTLTTDARKFLAKCAGSNFVAFEQAGTATRIMSAKHPSGIELPDAALWDFASFIRQFIS